jgi:uncharacterized protein
MPTRRTLIAVIMLCLVAASYYAPFGQAQDEKAPDQAAAQAPAALTLAPAQAGVSLAVSATSLENGGTVTVTGRTQPGKPVYLEVWSANMVRSQFFDNRPDAKGVRPYKLYLTHQLPAFYHIYTPADKKAVYDTFKAQGGAFSYADAIKELGADMAYNAPARMAIDAYQTSLYASIIGSRGEKLPGLDDKETRRRAMQLTKSRFGHINKLLFPTVDVRADGSFSATVTIPAGSAPGAYTIAAYSDKDLRSAPATVENAIHLPYMYLANAGTSLNIIWPFLLTLAIGVFGVLMGAGGGFLLNPILLTLWPALPHTVVAGTVTPTVLFSQCSGIYNYSKIKFINWKLGVIMGLAMAAGGFIGPKLTELITLSQFKMYFGYILLVLAVLMFWQTTPGYMEKNKREQAILKEFKRRAEETAKAKLG